MSEFRIFCIGAWCGFMLVAIGSIFLGPPKDGMIAHIGGMLFFGSYAVAFHGRQRVRRQHLDERGIGCAEAERR